MPEVMAQLNFLVQDGGYFICESAESAWQGRLVPFFALTDTEKQQVLSWRNHPTIRQWMYQPEKITVVAHLRFIESLVGCADKQYFMLTTAQGGLGVIDFLKINHLQKSCQLGLYANPELQQRGMGSQLMRIALAYAKRVLKMRWMHLEVFADNTRALKLYTKFHFVITGEMQVNHKRVFCMQLKL